MPKKDQDFVKELQTAQQQGNFKSSQIKKSRSAEDLITKSKNNLGSKEIKELQAQITALLEQISRIKQEANQQIHFESQKAQNYLAQITKLTAELDTKEQAIKELTDQNNELRLNKLKSSDQLSTSQKNEDNYFTKYQQESKLTNQLKLQLAKLQKDLTITQQDLKSAQRIIELRTIKPDNKDSQENPFDYWTWIRIGLLAIIVYLSLNNQQKSENNHGRPRN